MSRKQFLTKGALVRILPVPHRLNIRSKRALSMLATSALLTVCGPLLARNPRGWDYPMFRDPELTPAPVHYVLATPPYLHLWKLAFAHGNPVVDTQLCAVIALQKHAGLVLPHGLAIAIDRVALGQRNTNGKTSKRSGIHWQMAQIAALDVVGRYLARHAESRLIQLDRDGPPAMAMAIDPLLFSSPNRDIIKIWSHRVDDNHAPILLRRSAIRGLQHSGDLKAVAVLSGICFNHRTPAILRIAAAQALSHLHFNGKLNASSSNKFGRGISRVNRIVSAILTVGRGVSSEIIHLCQAHSSSVQLIALRRIEQSVSMSRQFIRFDGGKLAARLSHAGLASIRHAVTGTAARAAIAQSFPILFSQLADARIYISDDARMAITRLAQIADLHHLAISDAMARISVPTTRMNAQTQMQSLLILGQLKIRAAIAPSARFLHSSSDRVVLAAVITLRRLKAVNEVPAVYHLAVRILNNEFKLKKEYTQKMAKEMPPGVPAAASYYTPAFSGHVLLQSQTMAQAFCMLGQQRYTPAIPTLVRLIPQFGPYSTRSREAAIWAIGKIDVNRPDEAIGRKLLARLNDAYNLPPEIDGVRAMSAVTLARMNYKPALSSIESFAATPEPAPSTYACIWAAKRLAGKVYPIPVGQQTVPRGFIRPIQN